MSNYLFLRGGNPPILGPRNLDTSDFINAKGERLKTYLVCLKILFGLSQAAAFLTNSPPKCIVSLSDCLKQKCSGSAGAEQIASLSKHQHFLCTVEHISMTFPSELSKVIRFFNCISDGQGTVDVLVLNDAKDSWG